MVTKVLNLITLIELLALICMNATTLSEKQQKHFESSPIILPGTCMKNEPISNFTVDKETECGVQCLKQENCHSFNVIKLASEPGFECQIFEVDSKNGTAEFEPKPQCRYFEEYHWEKCPSNYTEYNGHCYYLAPVKLSFADARGACRGDGGDLAVIETAPEQAFLESLYNQNPGLYPNDATGTRGFYLGLEEIPSDSDNWYWIHQQELNIQSINDYIVLWSTSAWASNAGENCGGSPLVELDKWVDTSCSDLQYYLCEYYP